MNGYKREFDHFIDVVHGKAESRVKSKEILAVSKIATACEESARTGKIVDLKWTESELPDKPWDFNKIVNIYVILSSLI